MARIRSIKPEFWTSEQIAECSPNARLLFIGMWNFCDDYGVHPASVARLKMEVFPSDSFSKADVSAMVDELIEHRLIEEYEIEGSRYWYVTGWDRHQKPDTRTGRYPRPDGTVGSKVRRSNAENSPNNRGVVAEDSSNGSRTDADRSPPELELEQEKVNNNGPAESARPVKKHDGPSAAFLRAWSEYPKREGGNSRTEAWKAWKARLQNGASEDDLITGVRRYAAYCQAKGIVGTSYVKQAASFFGPGEHWREAWELTADKQSGQPERSIFAGAI